MTGFTRAAAAAACAIALSTVAACGSESPTASTPTADPTTSPPATSAAPSTTDPQPYARTGGELSFVTPWGAWCAMLPKRDRVPANPAIAGCWEITGVQQILTVNSGAKAEIKHVQQGFYVMEKGPELPVGGRLTLDGVTCEQSAATLVCTAGEHGFTLRPDNTFDLK